MNDTVITEDFKTTPYWWDGAPLRKLVSPGVPRSVDVAIVGSGYTGLSAALTLARAGRSVHVFDAEQTGYGASTRNAGFVGSQLWSKLSPLVDRYGTERACALAREALQAHQHLVNFIEHEQIACHFTYCGRFIGAHSPASYETLGRESDLLRRHLCVDTELVTRASQQTEIGSDHFHGGLVLPLSGALHPGEYHSGLLDRALSAGVTIHSATPVTGIKPVTPERFEIDTPLGVVNARHAIVATNGYTGRATPWLQRRLIPIHAGLGVSEPLDPALIRAVLPSGRTFIDTRRNPISIRLMPDAKRLQFTAARGLFVDDHVAKAREVREQVAKVVPALSAVRFSHYWTGQMGFTFDKLPHIGAKEGVLYAAGYCGVGMPMSTWLGHKLALRVLGDVDAATAFDHRNFPTRPFYRGRTWFLPPLIGWYALRDALEMRSAL